MRIGYFAAACLSVAISGIAVGDAVAQDVVKIGVVIPMTGGCEGPKPSGSVRSCVVHHNNIDANRTGMGQTLPSHSALVQINVFSRQATKSRTSCE